MANNKKKKKKVKKVKVIIPYTKAERDKQISMIKMKLSELGLLNYDEDMINIQDKMDKFVETGEEYRDHVKLLGTKRVIHITLVNNKSKAINVLLTFDKNV
jgi:hypothetical protein